MSDDLLAEQTLIDLSRVQRAAFHNTDWARRAHEYEMLLTAGIDADEAERIVRRAAADRAAESMEMAA